MFCAKVAQQSVSLCLHSDIDWTSKSRSQEITSKSRVTQRTTILNWIAAGTMVGSDLYRATCDTGRYGFLCGCRSFGRHLVADKSCVITYEPDGTNSACRLHSGSRVSLISAFLSQVRAPPFSPISDTNPDTPRRLVSIKSEIRRFIRGKTHFTHVRAEKR